MIYPNPINNQLNIEFEKENAENYQVVIFNSSGSILYKQEIPKSSPKISLDLSVLSSGLYLVNIQSESGKIFSSNPYRNLNLLKSILNWEY